MVSLKKIGAIATGALFIGATVGLASAVSVPSDFSPDMLAKNGEAKAQLVVGKDAPGKDADTASAEVIKDAVAEKLKVSGVDGDIKIEWASSDLNSDGNSTNDNADVSVSDYTAGNASVTLWFDADGDGSPEYDDDYKLYNIVYYEEGGKSVDVTFAYRLKATEKEVLKYVDGSTAKIRDKQYFVSKIDTDADTIKMGIISKKTIPKSSDLSNKITIEGKEVAFYSYNSTTNLAGIWIDGSLYYYNFTGKAVGDWVTADKDDKVKDIFSGDFLVARAVDDNSAITIGYVDPDATVTFEDGDEGVLGYAKVKAPSDITSTSNVIFEFRSSTLTVEDEEIVEVPDTLYTVEYDDDNNLLKIRTSEETTVSSGSKLRSGKKPYKEFLKETITVTAVGEDLRIEWGSKDLDSDSVDDPGADQTITDYASGNSSTNSVKLYFDEDGDGSPEYDDDYLLYDFMYYEEGGKSVDVTFAYRLKATEKAVVTDVNGGAAKIRGKEYFVSKIDTDADTIKMGIISKKTIPKSSDLSNKITIEGKEVAFYSYNSTTNLAGIWIDGSLYYYNFTGKAVGDWVTADKDDKVKDIFSGDFLVARAVDDNSAITIGYVDPDATVTFEDGDEGVLGYAKVKAPSDITSTSNVIFEFRSSTLTVEDEEIVEVPDTLYTVEYDDDNNLLKIRTSEETTVSSGSKLRSGKKPYKEFLKETITVTAVGGEEKAPELEIVDEDTANKDMNLVLIGGPVANKLTASLVEAGKSTVNWETSDGDIEVIADAFASGKYAIIVAGKTRTETRAAAEALAAAL
jgi:hypothetical protein